MTLGWFQEELETLYGVSAPRVEAFLVDEASARSAGAPVAAEALLVAESGGEVALGLWLGEEVRGALSRADPHGRPRLAGALLHGLACAAEGVSHFVYLSSRAAAGRPVSLLELEVQAEVDKFAVFLRHLWRGGRRRHSAGLRRRLFERIRFREGLTPEELHRYRFANALAGGYARWLERRFVGSGDAEGLWRELRRTWRRGGGEKIGYLGARG